MYFELLPSTNALNKLYLNYLLSIYQSTHKLKCTYSHSSMLQHQHLSGCPWTKTKAIIYSVAHAHQVQLWLCQFSNPAASELCINQRDSCPHQHLASTATHE